MKKLLLSAFSVLSLVYPHFVYGTEVELWKIFCAHQVMAHGGSIDSQENTKLVAFDESQWTALVADLNARRMPVGFTLDQSNMDAWLKCENQNADRFESAEFLFGGLRHFSVAIVSDANPLPTYSDGDPADMYRSRWSQFLTELQKTVTLPKARNTISMRAR